MTEVGRAKATGAIKARMERNFMVTVSLVLRREVAKEDWWWSERLSWLDWLISFPRDVVVLYVVDHRGRLRTIVVRPMLIRYRID